MASLDVDLCRIIPSVKLLIVDFRLKRRFFSKSRSVPKHISLVYFRPLGSPGPHPYYVDRALSILAFIQERLDFETICEAR